MVSRAIEQLLSEVDWPELDYLVVDLPPGTGDAQLTICQRVPVTGAVIVSTPNDVALSTAKRGLVMFEKMNVPILGIIENMSYFVCPHCQKESEIFSKGMAEKEAEKIGMVCLGKIPIEGKIAESGERGVPIVNLYPSSETSKAFIKAAESLPSDKVLILCNNKNIVLAAQQAEALCETKEIGVVPTRSVQQGIAALLALDQEADLQRNIERMMAAARSIINAEVTTATRDVELNGVTVRAGQSIGLLDGELVVSGDAHDEVVMRLLERVDLSERELITLYYGEGATKDDAEALLEKLQEQYPDMEVELIYGGQPHYSYFISVE